jgi:hypothetical protein
MFNWKDPEIYDEFLDDFPTMLANTGSGLAALIQNCLGFYIKNRQLTGEEMAALYRCRQVRVDKMIGSGEVILHGQRLYAYRKAGVAAFTTPQDLWVSPNAVGTPLVDFMFCGWAKEDAGANDAVVLINMDGTRPDQLF